MKKLLVMIVCLLIAESSSAFIVNNSTTSPGSEDSLSVMFVALDSLGNPSTADSVYIVVGGPSGVTAYKDSVAVSDSRVTLETIRGNEIYRFTDQVSNIDGSGQPGCYSLTIVARNTSLSLSTPSLFSFQIISTELSTQLALSGTIDSASVAAYVWNTPKANHNNAATFGDYLDTDVSGLGPGAGAYAVVLVAYDSSTLQPVGGVSISVRNLAQTALIATGATDANGQLTVNVNAGSYVVAATAPAYVFEASDTLVVGGAAVDTSFGYPFDPGSPASPALCRVYGYLYDISGLPVSGIQVAAGLPSGVVQASGMIVSPYTVSTVTDSVGYFYLDLLPSDDLVPIGSEYEFSLTRKVGAILRQRMTVPDQSSWQLVW